MCAALCLSTLANLFASASEAAVLNSDTTGIQYVVRSAHPAQEEDEYAATINAPRLLNPLAAHNSMKVTSSTLLLNTDAAVPRHAVAKAAIPHPTLSVQQYPFRHAAPSENTVLPAATPLPSINSSPAL
eukprot:CAMPEP_0173410620 /NCGR_PEP_ID=MMETSP1356-20130122/75017_1 /TAXON_ID=77927 ORGANISM="Hemiselmis virescens, Strain PCC157" /NCGR_SAMPLE_ID=MMETSP1356 /ASSEMBLY_ACC=CAM_ASM_000847 /LENGTH=128 /DNA_ID=CAMNT_0014372257 /DNA_START=247 /DNA_END=633 /DNA_ORIENTATION=-